MASSLEEFLAVKDLNNTEKTITVTAKDDTVLDIDIKALPIDQIKRIRAVNTFTYPTPQGGVGTSELDAVAYTLNIAVAGIKAPNFKDKQLLKKFHVSNAQDVLTAIFPLTEIATIAREVENLSVGETEVTNGTSEEKVKEAKNS